ncbi:MAG: MmcQ/YjbR family DNA-binding protein [Thermaurantiacus tibetensis]
MTDLSALEADLLAHALALPEAHEDFPWGERVVKVRAKIFLFLGLVDGMLRVAVKLPASHPMALLLDGCMPTPYGLGRHGWVTARLGADGSGPDPDLLPGWIEESYRAVAPRRLARTLSRPS